MQSPGIVKNSFLSRSVRRWLRSRKGGKRLRRFNKLAVGVMMVGVFSTISLGLVACGTPITPLPAATSECNSSATGSLGHCFVGWGAPSAFSGVDGAFSAISYANPKVIISSSSTSGGFSVAFVGLEEEGTSAIVQIGWSKGIAPNGVYYTSPELFTEANSTAGHVQNFNGFGQLPTNQTEFYNIYSDGGSSWALGYIQNGTQGPPYPIATYHVSGFSPNYPVFWSEEDLYGDYVPGTVSTPVIFSEFGHETASCAGILENPSSGEENTDTHGAGDWPDTPWNGNCGYYWANPPTANSMTIWDART